VLIALTVLFSLIIVRRHRVIRDPFASQAPLSSFTRGIVERDRIGATAQVDESHESEPADTRDRELANA
jgi:hypothetical protein